MYMFLVTTLLLGACGGGSDDNGGSEPEGPYAGTLAAKAPVASDITETSMTLYSQLVVTGTPDYANISAGFCYGTANNPTIADTKLETTIKNKSLTATANGLTAGTTYYVRAYISPKNGEVSYSPQTEVMTLAKEDPKPEVPEELKNYQAPTYADDYRNQAGWAQRSQWNLANVHDPSVVLAEDGYYYMYQTDASYGNEHMQGGHFHGRRSKNLVDWEYLGGTMKSHPEWVVPKLNEIRKEMGLPEVNPDVNAFGYWAPCVDKVKDGLYRMYYSIVVPGYIDSEKTSWSERAFIGLMENSDPANNDGWVDKGFVVTNASDRGLNFYVAPNDWANCYFKWNAIDPSYIITPEGSHWLIYGSWHSGIVALELDGETGKPKKPLGVPYANNQAPEEYGTLIATRQMGNRWQGSEGPEIMYNEQTGYYYLFLAYDALDVPYNTRVARSQSITGPYLGIDGANVTTGADALPVVTHPYKFQDNAGWVGISHCGIFDDGKGNWYYTSQGRFPNDAGGNAPNAVMLGHVRSIVWTKDGWPLVLPERYGAVPQAAITEAELVGLWEHIDLSYKYGEQKGSSLMRLGADHKITEGPWTGGKWSYDANTQILTANGVELYLKRETDWEASPRTHTIVYAGIGGNYKTYWGKKK